MKRQRRAVDDGVTFPLSASSGEVDTLKQAPVNAPATWLPNLRSPLSGKRLRLESACGRCAFTRRRGWIYRPFKHEFAG